MLVFVDESGDTGLKQEKGSSQFFVVALVVFDDVEEAQACDQRIGLLKKEIGWPPQEEFHFKRNSNRIREAFLSAVSPYNFFYYGIVVEKDLQKLWGEGFKNKASFYKYVCGLVFENAKGHLSEATVIFDQSSSQDFQRQLAAYLKKKGTQDAGRRMIKKVKMQRSQSNHLLQLADYVAGTIYRSILPNREEGDTFRRLIAHREIHVQRWPK